MPNMKLTRLSTSELKLDSAEDFCLNSYGNCMVLSGNSGDITVFELMNSCDTMILMPYSIKQITIGQHKPISEVIKNVNLVKMYENSNVQDSQELALDIIYTADCTSDPLKARALQANVIIMNNVEICCILTNYGYCEIFKKAAVTEEWTPLNTNLSDILITEIFPLEKSPANITSFDDFKTHTNKLIITCFVMSLLSSDLVIYLGTAAGYVIALKYNEESCRFEKLCHLKTSLNRISYIVIYKNLILVSCNQGKVLLVKVSFENATLQEMEYLWSKSDRMSCRKAVFTYCENLKSYIVVFCKGAHVLANCLDLEGAVKFCSTLYVSGIKITGVESINANEFIITTITNTVKYIKIVCPNKEQLYIEEQLVDHEFDSMNYQILGVTASLHKNLWSFLLYRNKDYVHQSKYSASSAFLNVCKLNNQDSFVRLTNLNLKNMNMAQDLIMAINLDIFNHMEHDKYMSYLDLEKLNFPNEINDAFLQKLHIKIIITRKFASYQNIKYKKLKTQTNNELNILKPTLQMLNILRRLCYLKNLQLSKFQRTSIICMQLQFGHLLNDITTNKSNEEDNTFHKVVHKFVTFLSDQFQKTKFDTSNFAKPIEKCMICDQAINNFVKCEQNHEIKRCSISCTQLTLFKTKQCPNCYALVRNDDAAELQELFASDEIITCVYCRFLLREDEF